MAFSEKILPLECVWPDCGKIAKEMVFTSVGFSGTPYCQRHAAMEVRRRDNAAREIFERTGKVI